MANSQKVVDVPDIGVVAFPGDMEDTHVANYIKMFVQRKSFLLSKQRNRNMPVNSSQHSRWTPQYLRSLSGQILL